MEKEIKLLQALFWGKRQGFIFDRISEKHFADPHLCYVFKKAREVWRKHDSVDIFSVFDAIKESSIACYDKLNEGSVLETLLKKDPMEVFNSDIIVDSLIEKKASEEALKKLDEIRETIETYGVGEIDSSLCDLGKLVPRKSGSVKTGIQFENELLELVNSNTLPGIPTPFPALNRLLSRFDNGGYKSGVYCIGGASKTGKSVAVRNITIGMALRHTVRAHIYNYELDKNEMNARQISLVTRLPIKDIINPIKSPETVAEIKRGIKILKDLHEDRWFMVDSNPPSTMRELRNNIEYLHQNFGTKLFVVDTFNKVGNENDNSYKGYKDNAQEFERIAKELDVTIVLICQLIVDSKHFYKDETGKVRCTRVDPRTVKPNCQDSNDTKELHKTCSSFLVVWWDKDDNSIVYMAEDAHRYGIGGLVAFKFNYERESYTPIENIGGEWN